MSMQYKIVSGSDEEVLQKNVMNSINGVYDIRNNWIEGGWKPFGGVAVVQYENKHSFGRMFYQAMIKE